MTAQSGLGFSGIVAIQIPDDGAPGTVLTKITADNYDYDWLPGGGGGGSTVIVEDEGIVVGVPADTLNFVGAGVTAAGAGTTKTITIPGGAGDLQAAYDADTSLPQILINATPDALTIQASVTGPVFQVRDTVGANILEVDDTFVEIDGQLRIVDAFINHAASISLTFDDTFTTGGGFNGGSIASRGTVTYDNGFFIWALLAETKTYRAAAAPGFAAFTLFNALPIIQNLGNFNLVQALVLNAGVQHRRITAGTSTVTGTSVVASSPSARATVAGAVMTKTSGDIGLRHVSTFTTVAGSTVNLGVSRGVHYLNPTVAFFGTQTGVETATALIALDVEALPFGGNIVKAAVRSRIVAASNARFLSNLSTAESDFGAGDIHLNDNTFIKYGGTVAAPDVVVGWDTTQAALVYSTFFGITANPLYLRPSATDTWVFGQNNGGLLDIGLGFNVNAVSFGVVDPVPNSNNWFVRFEGPNNRQVQSAGVYSDVWWTAGGTIDVNGLAVTEINSFRIDANVTALNGGTVQDQSGLFIAGMGFPGSGAATRLQSLRIQGRSRMDGLMNYNEASLAQLTADATITLPVTNSGRFMILQDADANGPWTIEGVVNDQPGDAFYFINDGANGYFLGHEDVGAAAADRIISPTGVDLLLGPNEMAKLWYDPVATRWRILETTGA